MAERTAGKTIARAAMFDDDALGHPLARLLGALFLLGLAAGCALVFLATFDLVDGSRFIPEPLAGWIASEAGGAGLSRLGVAAGSLLLGLLCLAGLLRSFSSGGSRGAGSLHVLLSDDRGLVLVETRGVSAVATAAVLRVQGVVDAQVGVSGRGVAPVRLRVRAWARPGFDLRKVGEEARRRATEAVETLVGLEVQDTIVKMEVLSIDQLIRMVD
jgi:hypothetical protein